MRSSSMGAGSVRLAAALLALALAAAGSAPPCAAQPLRRNYYAGVCPSVESIVRGVVVKKAGGPSYAVELGRLDGLSSTKSSVDGKLPAPFFNLDQLNKIFAANGLSQADMIALSAPLPYNTPDHLRSKDANDDSLDACDDFDAAGHTVGLAHCGTFSGRLRGPSAPDPTLDRGYAAQLRAECPANVDPRAAVSMDPVTPVAFDNQYFRNLQGGKGLLASDQVLYTDPRSRPIVDAWARSAAAFNRAFVAAITKLGRVGVKTGAQGNIRRNCAVLN
ncbi:uncharacterized protein C2845_PM04G00320 [Panicum miliaceum]|uniref:Plant heme peroxidase family profile domain-containing protein n=1 Tax=Panicum miliaceum TaxID=4540 RepID=A0A3L6QR27_PANMI|nr:uncharacterized protein C2845_PM04G00320 [Panicum miliaceum]